MLSLLFAGILGNCRSMSSIIQQALVRLYVIDLGPGGPCERRELRSTVRLFSDATTTSFAGAVQHGTSLIKCAPVYLATTRLSLWRGLHSHHYSAWRSVGVRGAGVSPWANHWWDLQCLRGVHPVDRIGRELSYSPPPEPAARIPVKRPCMVLCDQAPSHLNCMCACVSGHSPIVSQTEWRPKPTLARRASSSLHTRPGVNRNR
jgi:hypothetical protein